MVEILEEPGLLPEIRGQEAVGTGQSSEGGLGEVAQSLGVTTSRSEHILYTSELQHLGGGLGSDDASTTGSGNKAQSDRSALAGGLGGHSVGLTDLVTPITTTNGDDGKLGQDDGGTDSSSHLLSALHTETDVSVAVANDNEGLETSPLTGTSLLLHRHDLQYLILELLLTKEVINYLVFFDGHREQIDLFEFLDVTGFDKTTELGGRDPRLLAVFLLAVPARAPSTRTAGSSATSIAALTPGSTTFTGRSITTGTTETTVTTTAGSAESSAFTTTFTATSSSETTITTTASSSSLVGRSRVSHLLQR